MNTITVKKSDLLDILRKNRESHRETFVKAQEVYRKAVIAELDRMLAEARNGDKIRRAFSLPEPEEHTEDYDMAIAMLEMDVGEEVELNRGEFATYVMDEWGWQMSFAANTSSYVTR